VNPSKLETKLKELVRRSEQELREKLVFGAVGAGSMRASGKDAHNKPGWYTARTADDLARAGYPVRPDDCEFPVPVNCPSWHSAERDGETAALYRFFATRAHLEIPTTGMGIRFRVLFGLSPECVLATEAECAGASVTYEGDVMDRCIIICPPEGAERITVTFTCPIAGVPARVHPGATDQRLLSAAIAAPEAA